MAATVNLYDNLYNVKKDGRFQNADNKKLGWNSSATALTSFISSPKVPLNILETIKCFEWLGEAFFAN